MTAFQIFMIVIGSIMLIWGALILLSERFYKKWRDLFWREPNEGHLSSYSYVLNRYIEGGGQFALGALILYLMLFA